MKSKGYLVIVYGLIILAGGVAGHIKAGSTASLVSGLIFGFLLSAAGIGMIKNSLLAFFSSTVLLSILTLFFAYRFYLTGKFMPPGLLMLLTLVVIIAITKKRKTVPSRS